MNDKRKGRSGQSDAVAAVPAIGFFALFMFFVLFGLLVCHDIFGCGRTTTFLLYGFSLFNLAASMRFAAMAAGRRPGWALPLAAVAIVHVVILALLR